MPIDTKHGVHKVPGFETLVGFNPRYSLAYTSNDENDKMIITVTFTEISDGTRVVLVHSKIPDTNVDQDFDLREIIRRGGCL